MKNQQLSRSALVALVVGSMVGAGIFTLPAVFARSTGALGALISWAIAGTGMLMLAFVFQSLSRRKPELDAGIYAYAKAGFGNYVGFAAAFGYWIACCLACLACLILVKATLGQFFPAFGDGSTVVAILSATAVIWAVQLLVAAYGLKLAWTGETYATDTASRTGDRVRGALATVYAAGMLFAGGAKFLMLSALLYAPGTWLFFRARREQQMQVFSAAEAMLFGTITLAATGALYALASGAITL